MGVSGSGMAGQGGDPDVIVIGSGFGGAISACRLAESGRRVLVLERGQRRSGDQFPRITSARIQDWLWTGQWNGFFDFRVFPRIATLASSGVGGGSHAYANVHIRAPERTFREGWPSEYGPALLAPYYERVERMLGVQPFPSTVQLSKRRAYQEAARGQELHAFAPNLAVHFADDAGTVEAPVAVRDPYHLGIDVLQEPCRFCGECDIGCRYHAKNTLDLNYLAIAEQRHGATIQPLSEAVALAPENGGYRVHYQDRRTFQYRSRWAPAVVLAAGTLGSLELLLRCRDEFGLLPELSAALGTHFSGNGDFLCAALNTREMLEPWRGPVITTALQRLDESQHFYLQEGGMPADLAFIVAAFRPDAQYVSKLLRGPLGHAAKLRLFYQELGRLVDNQKELAHRLPGDAMLFLGMGEDASDGQVVLRKRLGRRPKLHIEWDHAGTQPLLDAMESELRQITARLGGQFVRNPLYSLLGRLITVHPLGGCALADDESQGVANPDGELWGYPNLYIADGAAIPRALGPNPSLTISAVAERIAERIVSAS